MNFISIRIVEFQPKALQSKASTILTCSTTGSLMAVLPLFSFGGWGGRYNNEPKKGETLCCPRCNS